MSTDDLKQLLLARLLSQSDAAPNAYLISVLQSQMARSSSAALHTEVANLTRTVAESTKLLTDALKDLSSRVIVLEQSCKSQAQSSKRKHDDLDHDHHEGEKRQNDRNRRNRTFNST